MMILKGEITMGNQVLINNDNLKQMEEEHAYNCKKHPSSFLNQNNHEKYLLNQATTQQQQQQFGSTKYSSKLTKLSKFVKELENNKKIIKVSPSKQLQPKKTKDTTQKPQTIIFNEHGSVIIQTIIHTCNNAKPPMIQGNNLRNETTKNSLLKHWSKYPATQQLIQLYSMVINKDKTRLPEFSSSLLFPNSQPKKLNLMANPAAARVPVDSDLQEENPSKKQKLCYSSNSTNQQQYAEAEEEEVEVEEPRWSNLNFNQPNVMYYV